MKLLRHLALLGLTAALVARAGTEESNVWPIRVAELAPGGEVESWRALGPLLFEKPAPTGGTVAGFRPFYIVRTDTNGHVRERDFLYPLFTWRDDGEVTQWSVFQLINSSGQTAGSLPPANGKNEAFDVWPFWFSRDTGDPATSYKALFPIAGTIKYRFGYDRISWTIWPLYMQSDKKGAITTSTPWPFIRRTTGTEQGFALWPLFGWREKPGVFEKRYYLWPLIWNNTTQPAADAPAGTPGAHASGFLPFYTRETRAGFVNQSYLWPFFGYTHKTQPVAYDETRYLWPLLVQGRGERYVNRWGPFYTHSIIKGTDKTWVMWPLFREAQWSDAGLLQTKTQFFFFLYWSLDQQSATNPNLPHASKTHVWPLFSSWKNGAGREQFQFISPLEVFMPNSPKVREAWNPLFALYRYDQQSPVQVRRDALFGLVTWRRDLDHREFHLGPLFSVDSRPDRGRIAIGNGLLGLKRAESGRGWKPFWFDFKRQPAKAQTTSR
ncbi:MAG: hypothetical protein JSS11_11680 [Verrucomicrobia bacterium]|nr:hypothetical protein [Verrucomicrobiota bacterium]